MLVHLRKPSFMFKAENNEIFAGGVF